MNYIYKICCWKAMAIDFSDQDWRARLGRNGKIARFHYKQFNVF